MKHKFRSIVALWLAAAAFSFCALAANADEVHTPVEAARTEGRLYAAGTPFGVRFHTDGVVIVGICGDGGPAAAAGLKKGDVIVKIDGEPIFSVSEFAGKVEGSGGGTLLLEYRSGGELKTAELTPLADDDGTYKLGVWIKDSAAGIGTITFVEPDTLSFGGLGHGICDGESGALVPFAYGTAEKISLSGVIPGKAGAPGELRGSFVGKKQGKLLKNTMTGVYGVLSELPEGLSDALYPVGGSAELREGKAYIFTTVDGEGRQKYEIEIGDLDKAASGRNFTVRITDPALIEKTGGIVQGMSGSPVIQNGKLVGAITHVLVSDPTEGYGICIEKMLAESASATALGIAA